MAGFVFTLCVLGVILLAPTCIILGLVRPALVWPGAEPSRWKVLGLHGALLPFLFLCGLGTVAGKQEEWEFSFFALLVILYVFIDILVRSRKAARAKAGPEATVPDATPEAPPAVAPDASPIARLRVVRDRLTGFNRHFSQSDPCDQLEARYRLAQETIAERFSPGEMTSARYRGLLDGLMVLALEKLERAASILNGIKLIDEAALRKRLAAAKGKTDPSRTKALTERLEILESGRARVAEASDDLDDIITAMDRMIGVLSGISTDTNHDGEALEDVIGRLESYLDNAAQLDVRGAPAPALPDALTLKP